MEARNQVTSAFGGLRTLLAPACVLAISLLISLIHIWRFPEISVLDEFQHADYVERLMHLELPSEGSRIEEPTLREDACRTHQEIAVPSCEQARLSPNDFPGGGYQNAAAHPPGYYATAAAVAQLYSLAPGHQSFVAGARLASALLTALGCLAIFALLRELNVDEVVGASIAVLAVTVPTITHASAIVSPDSTSLLFGAGIPLLAIFHLRRSLSSRWLVVGSILLGLSKVNNLLVLVVVATMIVFGVKAREYSSRVGFRVFALIALPATITYGAWSVVSRLHATEVPGGMPIERVFRAESLHVDDILNAVPALFPPSGGVLATRFWIVPFSLWATLLGWLLIGGVFLGAANSSRGVRGIAWGSFLAACVSGPFLVLTNFYLYEQYYAIPSRYGMVLVPAMLVGLGVALLGLGGRIIAISAATVGLVSYLWVFLPHRP